MTKSTGTVRKLMRSSTDGFNLRGCKVVQKECYTIEISAALQDNSLVKGWNLLKDETDVIARSIVEIMLGIGFAVEHMPLDDSQPQDKLLNHQMDSDIPGYNMTEICEVRALNLSH